MSYVISVGGDPINPNPFTFSQISMTENISLVWPSNTQDATYTATDWIDITSSAAYAVTMPPANEVGEGQEVVFNNYGSFTITINNESGSNITTIASGETKRVWVTDNSTGDGTWRIANIGSGTTQADASMLAGYGLIAQAGLLSQSMPPLSYSTDATIDTGARAALVKWTGGVGTFTMTSPATLGSNWFFSLNNSGSGILTIDGDGHDIDGQPTVEVSPGEGFTIATDGVDFTTVGKTPPTTNSYSFLTKSVAGSTDVTLTSSESNYSIIYFTGILTGNINVIVPAAVNEWVVFNNTTGAFTLTVKTASGTGVEIIQGSRRIINCDGTDVNYSDSTGTGTVTSISTGTGLSGGPITTTGTISIANTSVISGNYGSAGTVATYTVNPQGQLTSSSGVAISITDSNISAPITVPKGGTGLATLTANNVILGNGTSSPQFVAPGTSGNVLTSTGTTWTSSASSITVTGSPANGNLTKFSGATSITNADLTGDITTSGGVAATLATVNSNVGSFTSANITVNAKGLITAASNGGVPTALGVGSIIIATVTGGLAVGASVAASSVQPKYLQPSPSELVPVGSGDSLSGTWQALQTLPSSAQVGLVQRIA